MKRLYLSIVLLIAAVTVVAASSIAFHRYIGQGQTKRARRLREFYCYEDPPNKPGHAFLLDLLIPAAICGLSAGVLLARWPQVLFFIWPVISLLIVMLWPIYHSYVDGPFPMWWSMRSLSSAERIGCWFASYLLTALLGGAFNYAGWAMNPHRSKNGRSGRAY